MPPEHGLAELEALRYDLVLGEQYRRPAREKRGGFDYQHLSRAPVRVVLPTGTEARSLADLGGVWVLAPDVARKRAVDAAG